MAKVDSGPRFISKTRWIAVHRERRERTLPVALERHEGYELVLVDSGCCELQIEQRTYTMGRNDVAFIAEGEHHRANVPERCTLTYIDFRPGRLFSHRELLDLFLRPFRNGLGGGSHCWSGRSTLVNEVRRIARAVRAGGGDALRITEGVLRLLRAFADLDCALPRRSVADRLRVQPALDLIFSRYGEALGVAEMAEACAMSRATFKRVFRSATGGPPKAFLNEQRLRQASRLLLTTDRKVADIAFTCGFSSITNFNRRFLSRFGETPSRHRGRD
jgi:AraC-like DNA-binding protein